MVYYNKLYVCGVSHQLSVIGMHNQLSMEQYSKYSNKCVREMAHETSIYVADCRL